MPWARLMIVEERGWLDEAGFVNLVSLSQVLPGPNIVNLSVMLGRRFAGTSGALAALGGLMIAPLTIVLILGALYERFGQLPQLNHMFGNLAAAAAGLILTTAAKMARPRRSASRSMPAGPNETCATGRSLRAFRPAVAGRDRRGQCGRTGYAAHRRRPGRLDEQPRVRRFLCARQCCTRTECADRQPDRIQDRRHRWSLGRHPRNVWALEPLMFRGERRMGPVAGRTVARPGSARIGADHHRLAGRNRLFAEHGGR